MVQTVSKLSVTEVLAESTRSPNINEKGFVTRAMSALIDGSFETREATRRIRISALRLFGSLHGEIALSEISRDHAETYINLMVLCPVRGNGLKNAISRKRFTDGLEKEIHTLSANTVRSYLKSLSVMWEQLYSEADAGETAQNPFVGHDLPKGTQWANAGLSLSEIKRIFSLPVFTQGIRPQGWKGEACYWMPLLLMVTGAKPEQISRLTVNDFLAKNEVSVEVTVKISQFRKLNSGDRQLKTGRKFSSSRTFPLPDLLIKLGFMDYVYWLRDKGEDELFPELKPKGIYNELFIGFELWWEGYLSFHNVSPKLIRPARAFQRTWITQACLCGISQEAQNYILGRTTSGSLLQNYDQKNILGSEILKIDFEGYGLSQILKWSPR
jgi:integrase